MSKIFGLDLGTNSIGWALRNPDLTENQIEKFGVLTFNKGVGNGKTGEYSFAAERTKKRSSRRLYQVRKYRLWATLEHLITEGYCPLTIEDLDKWRKYDKTEARKNNNGGRIYPVWNVDFENWIKLDFDGDGKPDYASPYQLRHELAFTKSDFTREEDRFKLGRALYHIAQRRGFKSSRKGADDTKEKEISGNDAMDLQYSEKKKNKNIIELFEKYPQAKTIGSLFALLENDHVRIRENITQYAIRENYKDELKHIFDFQGLGTEHLLYSKLVESGKNKNDGSIFYKRPLRSQKGLIGKCTLEPNKYRAPVSHPAFETFRAWSFLNNINYKPFVQGVSYKDNPNEAKKIEASILKDIFQNLFFRKSKSYFPFSEISTYLKSKGYHWQLNYNPKTTVTACPVSARLKDIFGEDYLNVQLPKDKAPKSDKAYYDIEDIWHVLFNYEDQEHVVAFAKEKLKLDDEQAKQFVIAWNALPVGYGMLSLNAIRKINAFLEKGLIYTEAVLLANIPEIIGKDLWKENESFLLKSISEVISRNRNQKIVLNIVNNLISKLKNAPSYERFGGNDYKLVESDLTDIQRTIEEVIGINKWNSFSKDEKDIIFQTIKDCYQAYFIETGLTRKDLKGERHFEVVSNNEIYYKSDSGFYRLPKLIDTLGEFLIANFSIDEKQLSTIYHPSEISIYPPAKEDKDGILRLGSPKTGSFKNPMAMRTLHELRKLMNYMIETKQIDHETRIVVEVARDLNDANKRWAIEAWQRQREAENQEFAEAIRQLLGENNNITANAGSNDDIDKVRLFYEQNDEQTLPPVLEIQEDEKGKKKKTAEKDEIVRWHGHGKKLIDKYRLWKEQGYQCMYTGKLIKLTDLFDENITDFEHTIPRSQSFDNSLANLTVCYHDYNRTVKKNQIPTQLLNYNEDYDFGGTIRVCKAIYPRLKTWQEKVERIKQQIDFWKTKSRKAPDKSWKDDAIRQRHLWQMELDYWQNKLNRFTITEITTGFKNSQMVDTQLISKYAFHYLKTYFDKVDVQKGSITAEFRKIYQLQSSDEKKDRSKHSHHAKDAAVLTLIPIAAQRDAILEKYYEAKEINPKITYTIEPYKGFKREFVWGIDDTVLINNITNNQELTPAKRKIRKRGREVIIDGKNRWATGDSIRGQLHQDTFYGAVRFGVKDETGKLLKDEDANFIQEEKVKYVIRVPFQYKKDTNTPGFKTLDEIRKQIVDEGLKVQIEKQVTEAGGLKEAFEKGIYLLDKNGNPHGNKIRHIRIWASVSEPLSIKKQTYLSDKEYKQHYWAANATNSFFAVYKGEGLNYSIRKNLFEIAGEISTKIKNSNELFQSKIFVIKDGRTVRELTEKEIQDGKTGKELQLNCILEKGTKVIFLIKNEDSKLLAQDDILKRLYVYNSFEKDGRLNFQYHLEARNKIEETYSESEIDFENPKPTLRFGYAKYDFLVEGYDFEIKMDGTIKWK